MVRHRAGRWRTVAFDNSRPLPTVLLTLSMTLGAMVVFAVLGALVPTTVRAETTYAYDAQLVARVDTRVIESGVDVSPQVTALRMGSASPAAANRGASMTAVLLSVATEAATMTVEDLSGSTLSNYNRFVKNLPAAAETPTITNLADGAVEFSANVPATNIPGSYATYTKIVGPDGVTTSFIKTTIAPDGSVVSVKVKYP